MLIMSNLCDGLILTNYELTVLLFPFFFFWINKRLFPKGKPHNQRIHEPKAQQKRKTDRTSPKTKEKATARNNQQQPRTTKQKTKHTSQPGKRHHTPKPSPQPRQRQQGRKETKTQPATKPSINQVKHQGQGY